MARGQGDQPVRGATGDNREVTTNIEGTKHDKDMDAETNRTGSPAGDKVIKERAKDDKS